MLSGQKFLYVPKIEEEDSENNSMWKNDLIILIKDLKKVQDFMVK